MALQRLQVILAQAGIVSRRGAAEWIAEGRVRVDGEVVREPGLRLEPAGVEILVDGRPLPGRPATETWKVHKPAGVTSTLYDPHARRTLCDLWGPRGLRLAMRPVGRLDRDSRGLLLATNDGELLYRLTHPRWQVARVYEVLVEGIVTEAAVAQMLRGTEIQGRLAVPEKVTILRPGRSETLLAVVLREGRKREVRRLCEAAGHAVQDLLRTAYGPAKLGDQPPGAIQTLSGNLLAALYRAVDLDPPARDTKEDSADGV